MRTLTVCLVFALQCDLASALPQSVVRSGADKISIHAEAKPLGTLLREVASLEVVEKLIIEAAVENKPVSVTVDDVTVADGIVKILDESGVNYIVWGGDGIPLHVFAGSPTAAARSPAPAGGGRAPTAGRGFRVTDEAPPSLDRSPAEEPDQDYEELPRFATPYGQVTDDARLLEQPKPRRVSHVGAVIGFGLILGLFLVHGRPEERG